MNKKEKLKEKTREQEKESTHKKDDHDEGPKSTIDHLEGVESESWRGAVEEQRKSREGSVEEQ